MLLTTVNLALCVSEERLKRTEMVRSAQDLLNNYHDGKKIKDDFWNLWTCTPDFIFDSADLIKEEN